MSLLKSSNPFCLKNLKLKLCTKDKKSKDYEFVPYSDTTNLAKNGEFNNQRVKSNFQPRTLAERPQLQSTKIEQSRFDYSIIEQSPRNCPGNKLSSTRITQCSDTFYTIEPTFTQLEDLTMCDQESTTCYSNYIYSSPINNNKKKPMSFSSSSDSASSEFESDNSCSHQETRSALFAHEIEEIYVCNVNSIPIKLKGDLNLKFGDRVRLIHKDHDYFLVQDIVTGQCGYVQFQFLTLLQTFLNQF